MATPFRLRLFDSCASKKDIAKPPQPRLSAPSDLPPPPPPPHLRHPPVVSSSGLCCRRSAPRPNLAVAADVEDLSRARETPSYLWRKEEKWHAVSCDGFHPSAATAIALSPSPKAESEGRDAGIVLPQTATTLAEHRAREVPQRQRRRVQKKKPTRNPRPRSRPRGSSSSAETHALFSSDDEDGEQEGIEETQISSQSNSTTDNSFDQTELLRRREAVVEQTPPDSSPWRKLTPCLSGTGCGEVDMVPSESLAVVKQSEDPRADFRRSMEEMVVEKGIYNAGELEQLLHCFLSLNSEHHHRSIIAAFQDVWEALFPTTPFLRSPLAGHIPVVN
ncbi:hypothetical protein HPP92_007740 [Vanilla planifolia]|uniref:Transcription repressor n=1 Tax=Vanilla planifolia TaxID=51239 RepID=A0A835RRZ6_VANPL|nr:hypothetical protein HPP92_007878 [Vanilla planifolia]KAG0490877.1 hypothetical protein HPP92_007740 [Vanilla planifolia]